MLDRFFRKLEQGITLALMVMLAVVVALATIELGYTIVVDIATPPVLFPGIEKLLEIFGKLLLVLIGIELMETMRAFAREGVVRVEVVLTVAIIALARKIIVLEPGRFSSLDLLGLAALLAALSFAYRAFVRERIHAERHPPSGD
jgi:uncharacterized membrane protein (DUF373 family)